MADTMHKDGLWHMQLQLLSCLHTGLSGAEILVKSGWSRSVGGVNPYLAVWARCAQTKPLVDAKGAAMELYELPSARGCTYVVPKEHFAMALALARGTVDKSPLQTATKYLGVSEAEIGTLQEAILEALGGETLSPAELKERLGDKVRNLGEEGKKRGQTTTLSLGLAPLQTHGQIVRVPHDGGLETQRYGYRVWKESPPQMDEAEALAEFADLYSRWAGPASLKQFQWMSGKTVAACKQAVADAGLVTTQDGRFAHPDLADAYESCTLKPTGRVVLTGSLDNLFHLRGDVAEFIGDAYRTVKIPTEKGVTDMTGLRDLVSHAIVADGKVIGVWEFEPASGEVVTLVWEDYGAETKQAVAETQEMIREHLGDCRSFSLDSPASRQPRINMMRELAKA